VRGGLDTLAKWVGASLKSVTRWLEQPEFSAFVRLADMEKLELPDEWIVSGTKVILVYLQEPLLSELSNEQEIGTKRDSIPDKVRPYLDQDETLSLTKRDSILDKMRLYLGQSETRLKNLIKPLLNLKQPHQATTRSASALRIGDGFDKTVAVDFSSWDVNRILEINHVHPKLRKKLTGVDAHWLLSWLLYAMSQAGRGIEQPLNYALDRLSRTPGKGVGGAYDAFANLPPAELIDLILERARDREWNEIMGRGTSRPRLLLPILLGEDALKASEYTSFDQRNDILS